MASKIVLFVISLFTVTALVKADGNLQVGDFTGEYKLLFHKEYQAMGILFLYKFEKVEIKTEGIIKAIDIQDTRGDSSSEIVEGGVNEDFVTITLSSKRSRGYSFIIDVYGYPDADGPQEPSKEDEKEDSNETESKEYEKEDNNETDSKEDNSKEENTEEDDNQGSNSEEKESTENKSDDNDKKGEGNEDDRFGDGQEGNDDGTSNEDGNKKGDSDEKESGSEEKKEEESSKQDDTPEE